MFDNRSLHRAFNRCRRFRYLNNNFPNYGVSMKNEDGFDKNQYMAEVSANIVNEVFGIVQDEARKYGDAFGDGLCMSLVRNTIFVLVYNSLTNINIPPGISPEEAEAMIKMSYAQMKDNLQNAIADGFEAASQKYSGQNLGYYCKVAPAGQPANTLAI